MTQVMNALSLWQLAIFTVMAYIGFRLFVVYDVPPIVVPAVAILIAVAWVAGWNSIVRYTTMVDPAHTLRCAFISVAALFGLSVPIVLRR